MLVGHSGYSGYIEKGKTRSNTLPTPSRSVSDTFFVWPFPTIEQWLRPKHTTSHIESIPANNYANTAGTVNSTATANIPSDFHPITCTAAKPNSIYCAERPDAPSGVSLPHANTHLSYCAIATELWHAVHDVYTTSCTTYRSATSSTARPTTRSTDLPTTCATARPTARSTDLPTTCATAHSTDLPTTCTTTRPATCTATHTNGYLSTAYIFDYTATRSNNTTKGEII